MSAVSRTAQFAKIQKILKKYYKPAAPPENRTVLEHLLFACCLEDARYETAEEAFAALVHTFFDWNEVRVTSLSELSEVMAALPDARAAANRVKRVLHGVFEELYSFDLEDKRKKNLGPTVKWLEKIDGTTKFSVAYVVQSALGGHSLPIDAGTLAALRVVDFVSDKDVAAGEVPGLERAVSKSKGVEVGSLLHHLGADFTATPFAPQVRDILLQIDPEASKRFPQRRVPRDPKAAPAPSPEDAAPSHAAASAGAAAPRKKRAEAAASEPPPDAESKKPAPPHGKKASPPAESPHGKSEKSEKAETHPDGSAAHRKENASQREHAPAEGLAKRKPR